MKKTPLFGQNGILDSLGSVMLVVALEQAIADEFGVSISLADERAMSQRHSPYCTFGSLAEYASQVIQAEMKHGRSCHIDHWHTQGDRQISSGIASITGLARCHPNRLDPVSATGKDREVVGQTSDPPFGNL
jgi:acyl carrier protein